MFFDTHLHLIYLDRLNYPWLAEFPLLNKSSKIEAYLIKAKRLGITDCLHMEVDVAEAQIRDETAMVAGLMSNKDNLLRGAISACRPESNDFAAFLEWAQTSPEIKGFRRVLHVVPDAVSQSLAFRNNIKRLTGTGLTFDICMSANQLNLAAELVDYCPDVQFILDHCGVPDIKAGEFSLWADGLVELAKRPNIIVKISGIIAYGDTENWGLDDLRPWFEHTVKTFGHQRIIWGSDSPVCNLGGGLETWIAATHALTADWTKPERNGFYKENAMKIWNI